MISRSIRAACYVVVLLSILTTISLAWSPTSFSVLRSCARQRQRLFAQNDDKPERGSSTATTATPPEPQQEEWVDEDAGAGVVGAQFFGGNKQKEEFYDPIAEERAATLAFETDSDAETDSTTTFDRFADRTAFDTENAAQLAMQYQELLNGVLTTKTDGSVEATQLLATNMKWESPLSKQSSSSLMTELQEAANFYRRIHVAISSVQTLSNNQYKFTWEIGVAWPTFWEPSVLLTGTSTVRADDNGRITQQVDTLDDPDLVSSLARQIVPRFWDVYHIGMTPTAELAPAWERKLKLIQNFVLYDVPGRWTWQPTLVDRGNREDANASFLPNHSFTTAIRTMGPKKDAYVPTTPTQVDIAPTPGQGNRITWKVPLTVQAQSELAWPLFQSDEKDQERSNTVEPSGSYVWQPARRVATLPTGIARPQDEGVADLRKRLYERVTAAGLKPKLDTNGRPCFFFWSAAMKTCFTDQGLGMAVYEYRPAFAQSNHVGLELQDTPELSSS